VAAKNRLLVDIFDLGTPRKSCPGEVAKLLAKGIRFQRLGEFGAKSHRNDSDNKQPFFWS